MTQPDSVSQLTNLLLAASIHHLRITTESLPVGQIDVDRTGMIAKIDQWTEALLNVESKDYVGKPLEALLGTCANLLVKKISRGEEGYAGSCKLLVACPKGSNLKELVAQLVVVKSLEPFRYAISVIFTA